MRTYACCSHCAEAACRPRYWNAHVTRPPRDEHPYACLLCAADEPGRQVVA